MEIAQYVGPIANYTLTVNHTHFCISLASGCTNILRSLTRKNCLLLLVGFSLTTALLDGWMNGLQLLRGLYNM